MLFGGCIIAYTVEVIFVTVTDIHIGNISCLMTWPTIYFLIVALLCGKKCLVIKLSPYVGTMANIIYYAHGLLLYLIPGVLKVCFHRSISQTMLFLVIIIILLPLSYVLAHNKKGIVKWIV